MARGNRFRGKARFGLKLRAMKAEVRLEIEKATKANAEDMARLAKAWAPIRKGGGGGDLRNSIRAVPVKDGAATRWKVVAGDEKAFYARMVEFGTAPGVMGERAVNASGRSRKVARTHPGNAAQPYFFTAYRALRKRLKGRLSRAFTRAKKKALAK